MRRLGVLLIVPASIALSTGPASAQVVRIPGTGVALVPPEGFSLAQRFSGVERADLQASIVVSEVPAPTAEMQARFTPQALAAQGMTHISSRSVRVDGADALLLELSQHAAGADFLKWMLVAGDPDTTILVVGSFPRSTANVLSDRIRESVLSTTRLAERSSDPFDGLLFRVTPTARLKLARRVSNMLALTESGDMPVPEDETLLIVGSAVADTGIRNLRTFSEWRAARTATLKNLKHLSGRPFEIAGLNAYELTAAAKDVRTGTAITLYQVVVPDGNSYFIIQGLTPSNGSAAMLEEFRRVAASFRLERGRTERQHP